MKRLLAILFLAGATLTAKSPFAGKWEAHVNDLPGIELHIRDAADNAIQGDIVFYFQRRGEDGRWRVEGEPARGPILNPQVEGKMLTFEVRHHKQHGGTEYGPNVKYRLELTADDELTFITVDGKSDGPRIKLRRRNSSTSTLFWSQWRTRSM